VYVFVRKGSGGEGGSSLPAEAWRSKANVMKKADVVTIFKFWSVMRLMREADEEKM
jgi:hypothetical protein